MTTSEARSAALDRFEQDYGKWVLGNCHAKTAEQAVALLADRFGAGAGREVPGSYDMRINGKGLTIQPAHAAGRPKPAPAVVPWLEVLDRLGWVPAVESPGNGVHDVAKAGTKRGKAAAANDDAAEERRETGQKEQKAMNGATRKATRMIPVEFSGVSLGEGTGRIGIKVSRDDLDIEKADEIFVGHRIKGRIVAKGKSDADGQQYLSDDMQPHVDASFEAKSISVKPAMITTSLNFALNDVDLAQLASMSNKTGHLLVETVERIDTDGDDD